MPSEAKPPTGAPEAAAHLFQSIDKYETATEALLDYTRQMEAAYQASENIVVFIFALRCFFCWPRAQELFTKRGVLEEVQRIWIQQNEEVYTSWLASNDDNPANLKWQKWTFQAKMSILSDMLGHGEDA